MPRFELALIIKLIEKKQKIGVLKDIAKYLINEGYNVRKVQTLGDRSLPNKFSCHGQQHYRGSYALVEVDFKLSDLNNVKRYFNSNSNILRMTCIDYNQMYFNKPVCDGIQPIDYEAKLEELKHQKKIKPSRLNKYLEQ